MSFFMGDCRVGFGAATLRLDACGFKIQMIWETRPLLWPSGDL
jgi:hypothetical protein